MNLVALPIEGSGEVFVPHVANNAGPAEISLLFVGLVRGQMAGAGPAVLHLAGGRQAESLFRSLMRFHLGHGRKPSLFSLGSFGIRPVILIDFRSGWKGELPAKNGRKIGRGLFTTVGRIYIARG